MDVPADLVRAAEQALALGSMGWMADFAEWMPIENVALASGEDPAVVHNEYPVLWAKLNDEVMKEYDGDPNGAVAFHRSGHLYSQRYVQVMWAGDQRTSFDDDDGLPTIVPLGLGLAATGFFFYAHDVAGYQSSTNDPASKGLFFRWTELGAFSPVMRTHHGTHARFNWNLRSDEESTQHWKRYASLHIRLYPYLRSLALDAVTAGRPLWIPMGLLYPDDEELWARVVASAALALLLSLGACKIERTPQELIDPMNPALVDGREAESAINRLFAGARVDYIHAHYATRGCYAGRIDRA